MEIALYLVIALCVLLVIALALCVRRIAQLVNFQEDLNVRVEDSLDMLESSYKDIMTAAGNDVAADDIFVRKVVASLFNARDAVHAVAEKLASFDKTAVMTEKVNTTDNK